MDIRTLSVVARPRSCVTWVFLATACLGAAHGSPVDNGIADKPRPAAQKGNAERSTDSGITPEQARRILARLRAWFSANFSGDLFGIGKISPGLDVLGDLDYAIRLRLAADYLAELKDGEINRIGRDVHRTPSLAAAREAVDAAFNDAQAALLERHRGAKARLRAVSVLMTINLLDDGNPVGMEIHTSDSSGASEIGDMFRDLGEVYPTEKSRLPSSKTMNSLRLKDSGFPDDVSSAPHSRIGVSWHLRVVDLEKKADKSANSETVGRDSLKIAPPDATIWLTYEVFGERKQNPDGSADRFLAVDLVSQRLVWKDGKWCADNKGSKAKNAQKK